MAFPALIARFFPWGAAAQAGVQLARLGMDYKLERDRLKGMKRSKDLEMLEARLDAVETRFHHQLQVMEELANGLQKEVGRMRRTLMVSLLVAAGAGLLSVTAIVLMVF